MTRRGLSVLAILTVGSIIVMPASASLYPPPMRPLTPEDRFDFSVAKADAIVYAELVRRESTGGAQESVLRDVRVLEWVKGKPDGASAKTTICSNRFVGEPERLGRAGTGQRFLLFLSTLPDPSPLSRLNLSDRCEFILENATGLGQPGDPPWARLRSDVRKTMAKQTPAQLAERADLIVLGRPNFGNPGSCSPFGLERSCISFVIQEQIRGTAPANPVLIYSVIPFYRPFESGVLVFLRKDATGTYEIVSGPAGFIGLDETGTDRQGVALTEWRRRVREAGRD